MASRSTLAVVAYRAYEEAGEEVRRDNVELTKQVTELAKTVAVLADQVLGLTSQPKPGELTDVEVYDMWLAEILRRS